MTSKFEKDKVAIKFVKDTIRNKFRHCKSIEDIEDAIQHGLAEAIKYQARTSEYAIIAARRYLFPRNKKKEINCVNFDLELEERLKRFNKDSFSRRQVHEDIEHLMFSLSKLSERNRSLLTDCYLNNLTTKEIAQKYNIKKDSVYWILSEARKKLKGEYYAEN